MIQMTWEFLHCSPHYVYYFLSIFPEIVHGRKMFWPRVSFTKYFLTASALTGDEKIFVIRGYQQHGLV